MGVDRLFVFFCAEHPMRRREDSGVIRSLFDTSVLVQEDDGNGN